MRILIVEDDLSLQANLAQYLQQAQYSVDVASDGENGLFQAQETLFDAAIIDVGLPKIDGIKRNIIQNKREFDVYMFSSDPDIKNTAKEINKLYNQLFRAMNALDKFMQLQNQNRR